MYKEQEIKEYAQEQIKYHLEYNEDYLDNDIHDIHHDLFNTDYYIIGIYQAKKWLGDKAFDVIGDIKEYEEDNFGELYTDLSDAEKVVNMWVYIVGEHILEDVINDIKDRV
tara:strand:+ start:1676 stop:2008 length:333 start_codon:yes stop_codon:yes gene_type:complete